MPEHMADLSTMHWVLFLSYIVIAILIAIATGDDVLGLVVGFGWPVFLLFFLICLPFWTWNHYSEKRHQKKQDQKFSNNVLRKLP